MTKSKFIEIMTKIGFTKNATERLWDTRPYDELDEQRLIDTAKNHPDVVLKLNRRHPDND